MHVHDGQVRPATLLHALVRVKAHQQKVALGARSLRGDRVEQQDVRSGEALVWRGTVRKYSCVPANKRKKSSCRRRGSNQVLNEAVLCKGSRGSAVLQVRASAVEKRALSILTWPGWKQSKAPSMYTMRAPSGAVRPLLNCTRRRLVGRKCDTAVHLALSSSAGERTAAARWRVGARAYKLVWDCVVFDGAAGQPMRQQLRAR